MNAVKTKASNKMGVVGQKIFSRNFKVTQSIYSKFNTATMYDNNKTAQTEEDEGIIEMFKAIDIDVFV